jgi:hypothetical protein
LLCSLLACRDHALDCLRTGEVARPGDARPDEEIGVPQGHVVMRRVGARGPSMIGSDAHLIQQ